MINTIYVLGNDERMDYVAEYFYSLGYEVSRHMEECEASIIIMPPPVSPNQILNICSFLLSGNRFYGGSISLEAKNILEEKNVEVSDYLKINKVTAENAILTAKGIIKQAITSGAVIEESNCLVTGYGFCGKALAQALKECNARVDVAVRNIALKSELEKEGFNFVDLNTFYKAPLGKYSYVFNTVPALIINSRVIDGFSNNVMLFDIASKPGGMDFDYCLSKNIFFLHSLGIPGKEYPKEAGIIIAKAVHEHINKDISS